MLRGNTPSRPMRRRALALIARWRAALIKQQT
jgi:hypothetical protein